MFLLNYLLKKYLKFQYKEDFDDKKNDDEENDFDDDDDD